MICDGTCPECRCHISTDGGMTVISSDQTRPLLVPCWQCGEPTQNRSPRPLCRCCREALFAEEHTREDEG